MRRTILLLATMALALVLVGGVAASKQRQEQSTASQSPTTTTDKSSGDVTIESTTVRASFASGTGANRLAVQVSDHGNLLSWESPAGLGATATGEGYAVCSDATTTPTYDFGVSEEGFGPATITQPNGAGTFPLTVTRKTTDGKLQLKQVWVKPDAVEKDVTVTMTLKNISSSTINNVGLTRTGDFDVGASTFSSTGVEDRAALTADSAFQWDDRVGGPDSPASGLQLTALTVATPHALDIDPFSSWASRAQGCEDITQITPTGTGDWAMRGIYTLGTLNAGQSKTVKFEYSRM